MPTVTPGVVTADAYVEALVRKDAGAARAVVDSAIAQGISVEDVYLEVLTPAMHEVGRRWALDKLTVGDEHYATVITQSLLGALRTRMRVPPKDGRMAVVSCTPDELHCLGAQMVADFLEADGWEVLALGAAMPVDALAGLVDRERPDVVGLSTTTAGRMPGVAETLRRLGELAARPVLAVGGQVWTVEAADAAERMGADVVAGDPRQLVERLRERFPPLGPHAHERPPLRLVEDPEPPRDDG